MIISPTLGRVMWYYPGPDDTFPCDDDGRCTAHVCKVNSPRSVNLLVIDALGKTYPRLNVPVVQEGEEAPGVAYCGWMPYQQQKAKEQHSVK